MRGLKTDLNAGERLFLDISTPDGVERVEITGTPVGRSVTRLRIIAGEAVRISKQRTVGEILKELPAAG